ncbi:hypothetical protein ACFY7C_36835 [Streptomyces sp. NPDC012769]|uniref:hypothetical protein n=1 Tax=Streptomyces sp. NPDC012769 TaxID=3364848 RepID=UPI003676BA76
MENSDEAVVIPPVANDDISVANRMAEFYKSQGIDPSAAYDSPDDAMLDFGPNGLKDFI